MTDDELDALINPPKVTLEDLFKPLERLNVTEVDFDSYEDPFPKRQNDLKCGDCGARMQLISAPKYKRPFYGCARFPECRGTMGARKDGSPLGRPIDREGREARMRAHAAFDQIWKDKVRTRGECYQWMQKVMGIPESEAHIAMLTKAQCERLIELVNRDFPFTQDAISQILYDEINGLALTDDEADFF